MRTLNKEESAEGGREESRRTGHGIEFLPVTDLFDPHGFGFSSSVDSHDNTRDMSPRDIPFIYPMMTNSSFFTN